MKKAFLIILLCSLKSFTTFGMEAQIRPQRKHHEVSNENARYLAKYLTTQLFGHDHDKTFEDIFVVILHKQKNPKLFPELVELRESLIRTSLSSGS